MDREPPRVQMIQSVLASWYEHVVQTHRQSVQMRQAMYQSFLAQQEAMQQSFLEMLALGAHPAPVHAGGLRIEVNASLVSILLEYWQRKYKIGSGLIHDLYFGLCVQFLNTLVFEDQAALHQLRARSKGVIFIANHQTAVESSLFSIVFGALLQRPIVALSKAEHRASWIGGMIQLVSEYPGACVPTSILYMDRSDQATVLQSFQTLIGMVKEESYSALVHVEGTRALQAGTPVTSISSALIDMACGEGVSLVPVRFSGGIPLEGAEFRLDFPFEFGSQDIIIGQPIEAEPLRSMSSSARKQFVLQKLNGLIVQPELPNRPNPAFAGHVERMRKSLAMDGAKLVLIVVLEQLMNPSLETKALLSAITGAEVLNADTAHHEWLQKTAHFFLAAETSNPASSRATMPLRQRG